MTAEQLIYRPLIVDCPQFYQTDKGLIESLNLGQKVSEQEALESYFYRLQISDGKYYHQLESTLAQKQPHFLHQLQIIAPAYRESENLPNFLTMVKQQFNVNPQADWGITFVFNYPTPYKEVQEGRELRGMYGAVNAFIAANPNLADRLDIITFSRDKNANPAIMPIGVARKFGEDVVMLERLKTFAGNRQRSPLYLGLMDVDTDSLSPGLLDEMAGSLPQNSDEVPVILRVQGSYAKDDVRDNPYLHILQEIWEGSISAIARHTKHNPFNIGRLSAVPARELAITGGSLARQLNFTDEDIRHGLQIAWQLNNAKTIEVDGKYATSARREINMMQGLLGLLEENNGVFNVETLETAALIRMYGDWNDKTFREHLNNIVKAPDFNQRALPRLLGAITNAFYRFTLFGIFNIERLSQSPLAPEIGRLRELWLAGQIPYFEVQIQTHEFIKELAEHDPQRFEQIKPILESVDQLARQTTSEILSRNKIKFRYDHPEVPMLGFLEPGVTISRGTEADKIVLRAPFVIGSDQSEYLRKITQDLAEGI